MKLTPNACGRAYGPRYPEPYATLDLTSPLKFVKRMKLAYKFLNAFNP